MRGKKDLISYELFLDFSNIYIKNLLDIINKLSKKNKEFLIVIPSTTAINQIPIGMVEYSSSKSAMEVICKGIQKTYPNIKIIMPRLNRVQTEQTLSVIKSGIESSEAAIFLANKIIKEIK